MVGLGYSQGPVGKLLMSRPRTFVDNLPSVNLFLVDGVGNLRDPRVGNIMTLDTRNLVKAGIQPLEAIKRVARAACPCDLS